MEFPFIIHTGEILNEEELKHLARYLIQGGFIIGLGDWAEGLEKYGGIYALTQEGSITHQLMQTVK